MFSLFLVFSAFAQMSVQAAARLFQYKDTKTVGIQSGFAVTTIKTPVVTDQSVGVKCI